MIDYCFPIGQLILSQSPVPKDVFDLLNNKVSSRWDDIGRELRVSYNDRQILKTEGPTTTAASKLETVIMKWVESKCSDVTWNKVIQVLSLLQFNDSLESTKLFLKQENILNKYLI